MNKEDSAPFIVGSNFPAKHHVDLFRTLTASVCFVASLSYACSYSITPTHLDEINPSSQLLISTNPFSSLMYDDGSISVFSTSVEGVTVLDDRMEKSLSALAEIEQLEDNWNENGAEAFSNSLIGSVRALLSNFNIQPDIFPTAQNSIQLEWENANGDYLEIELFEDSSCSMFFQRNDGYSEIRPITYTKIGDRVNEFFAINA